MRSRLNLFVRALLLLLGIAFAEKCIFALYYPDLSLQLSAVEMALTLLWGIRFDLAIATLLTLLAYLLTVLFTLLRPSLHLGSILRLFSLCASAVLIGLHSGDLLYFGEAGRHLGYELGEALNSGGDLATMALHYPLPLSLQLLLFLGVVAVSRPLFRQRSSRLPISRSRWLGLELVMILLLSAVVIRGGVQAVPLEPLHAQMIGDQSRATLTLNGAYNALFSTLGGRSVRPLLASPPSEEDQQRLLALYPDLADHPAPFQPRNIILLFLESWNGALMHAYGYERQATPYFDQLRLQGITTRQMVAGGRRTTEGMFATLCSFQNPLGKTIAQTQLQDFPYRCLPHQLRQKGYETAFFQGSNRNTSGTGAFAQLLGFTESFGKADITRRHYPENSWGVHDPDLYTFALEKMAATKQPFFFAINSNSTHDSTLPQGVNAKFSGEDRLTAYLNLLSFADQAVADFLKQLQQRDLMEKSIIVLVADHANGLTPANRQNGLIPFAILGAGVTPYFGDFVATQRDIAPTLQQLLGLPRSPWFSGRSLLNGDPQRVADFYGEGRLYWFHEPWRVDFALSAAESGHCSPNKEQSALPPCPREALIAEAVAFTRISQHLLFSGKTTQFPYLTGVDSAESRNRNF
ncbi:MAG: LTA synthase family protein [Gammaproteobacteria bacterium]|nr:LTA synthase family protein [Gammaproteobacteria bacterium]